MIISFRAEITIRVDGNWPKKDNFIPVFFFKFNKSVFPKCVFKIFSIDQIFMTMIFEISKQP